MYASAESVIVALPDQVRTHRRPTVGVYLDM
jgi:hypothetical protein